MTIRALLAACVASLAACAPHGPPGPLPVHDYRVLIEGHDSLSDALARALVARGVTVVRDVYGGGPRAVALITFTFRDETVPGGVFGVRLADTRSGAVVRAVSVPVDSLGDPVHAARLLVDSLLARPRAP